MKTLSALCPSFVKRLWFQLAVVYTLLAICAMALLIIILSSLNDYRDFRTAIDLKVFERQVAGEMIVAAQAIREPANKNWQNKLRASIRSGLIDAEYGSYANSYSITNSSRPEIYVQVTGQNGAPLFTDTPPQEFAALFDKPAQAQSPATIRWLSENGPVWMDMPVREGGGVIGRLRVLFIAEFDVWIQLRSIMDFLFSAWDWVIKCSIPIGLACGLVAARYVTRQLQKMNAVTESWRQGDFSKRIALPSDDVLTLHSRHLNDMAQDLEMYLSLKQNLAVTSERNRVARELHDTVKQKLFALGLQLAAAKSRPAVMDAAGEHIAEAETITREAQADLMEIITQLRPAGAGDTALAERVALIAANFKRRFGIAVDLRFADALTLDGATEHHVLRIVQEALANAVRHGNATDIIIACAVRQDVATLEIADNGKGFDTTRKTNGFGITSMRDRVRELPGGAIDIRSTPDNGTSLILSWKIA